METYGITELPDQEVLTNRLTRVKGRLFQKDGFAWLGSMLCSHSLIWDESAPTAWCDGSTIGINPWFFTALDVETRITLLAHELAHTMFDHMGRWKNYDVEIWNIAADFVINGMLHNGGFKFERFEEIGTPPCLDHKYDGMSTEEVYHSLVKEGFKPPPMMALICPETGQTGDEGDDPSQGQGDAPGSNQGNQKAGSGSNIPSMSADLRDPGSEKAHSDIMARIIQAKQAQLLSRQPGNLPGEIEQIIDEFLNPILPWEILLFRYFNELSKDDYSWKRPSRRYDEDYLPSLMGENGLEHLIYYIDVSGSITDQQALRFFSEVKYIHEELHPQRLTVVTFDTKIQDEYDFFQDEPFEKITLHGRGGTSLDPVRKHIEKHRPTAAVIFSDLFVYPMTQNPGVPVLWVVMGNKSAQIHFGTRIDLTHEGMLERSAS